MDRNVSIRLSNPGTDFCLNERIVDSVRRALNMTGAIMRRLQGATALQSV